MKQLTILSILVEQKMQNLLIRNLITLDIFVHCFCIAVFLINRVKVALWIHLLNSKLHLFTLNQHLNLKVLCNCREASNHLYFHYLTSSSILSQFCDDVYSIWLLYPHFVTYEKRWKWKFSTDQQWSTREQKVCILIPIIKRPFHQVNLA